MRTWRLRSTLVPLCFRLGIVTLILVLGLDVLVACSLYRLFSPVDKSLSIVAMAMRRLT